MPRKRRNKILILSAAYPPSPGGVATHVANLAHGLQRDGNFDISVLYSTEHSEHPYPNKKVSNRVVALPIKSKQVASFHGRRVPCQDVIEEALRHMNDGGSVKLVHVHDFDSLHVGWIIKMVFSVKLVLSLHRAPIPWHDKHYIENAKTCYLEAMRRHDIIDAITVPSKASRNVLLKQGFDENKVHVIPHGINKKYMASFDNDINLLSDASIGDEKILIFCPIRDDMHKDYHTFINATKYIKEKCTDEPIVF